MLTKEEKVEIAKKICNLYSTDMYTIAECVENQGISVKTFNNWKNDFTEVTELYKKCQEKKRSVRMTELKKRALTGLEKLITEREIEDKYTTVKMDDQGEPELTEVKTTKRKLQPNPTAVIFALKNLDPKHFRESQFVEHSGEVDINKNIEIDLTKLSTNELRELRELMKKAKNASDE